jgi:hypothetical protein
MRKKLTRNLLQLQYQPAKQSITEMIKHMTLLPHSQPIGVFFDQCRFIPFNTIHNTTTFPDQFWKVGTAVFNKRINIEIASFCGINQVTFD